MSGIIALIIVGLIAGYLAGLIMKGKGFGLVGNLVVGVLGEIANLLELAPADADRLCCVVRNGLH